jgi:hypothetical protein
MHGQGLAAIFLDCRGGCLGFGPALPVAERHSPAALAQTQPYLPANASGAT